MLPDIWGPTVWKSMHMIAAAYPEKPTRSEAMHYKSFFSTIGFVLPCLTCARSYRLFLRQHPLKNFLASKKSLMYWVYLMHNRVNRKLKKRGKISWNTICRRYAILAFLPYKPPKTYCQSKLSKKIKQKSKENENTH